MNYSLTQTMSAAVLGLLLLVATTMSSVSGQVQGNNPSGSETGNFSKKSIQGVWLIVVQRKDCQTSNPMGPPGRGLVTFADGGTLSETAAPGVTPVPFLRSAGHGVWERNGWSHYPATIISQRLNADGSFAGWTKLVATFQLSENGNTFTASGSFEVIEPNGNVSLTGCSTTTGTRLQ